MTTALIWLQRALYTGRVHQTLNDTKITPQKVVMSSTFRARGDSHKSPTCSESIVCVSVCESVCVSVCVGVCVQCRFAASVSFKNGAQLLTRNVRAKRRHCGRALSCQSKEVLLNLFKLWKHFGEKKQCSSRPPLFPPDKVSNQTNFSSCLRWKEY